MKKIIVLMMAFSIMFINCLVSNAQEKSNIPELLTEIVNRCSTDASYIVTMIPAGENPGITVVKAYYKDVNTYRIEVDQPDGPDKYTYISKDKKDYLYDFNMMKLTSSKAGLPDLLKQIGKSNVSTLAGGGNSNSLIYEFVGATGEKNCYFVDKVKKILYLTISYDKNGKESGRHHYSHWKFEKQPDDLFNEKLLDYNFSPSKR